MKLYGRICHDLNDITTESVRTRIRGVTYNHGKYKCNQCTNTNPQLFFHYYCHHCNELVVYCRYCIQLGKVQSCKDIFMIESKRDESAAKYHLNFELSEQQQIASNKIKDSILNYQPLLVHAVTGAGKTEMIFEGISAARQQGDNVAVVSPRVDVVKEVYLRLRDAFQEEQIDLMYEGHAGQYDSTFVVSTVHQLMRYNRHFNVIIVDEVDAFPLEMDNQLMEIIKKSSTIESSHIYLTATPPPKLLSTFNDSEMIKLPARYHGSPLPVPQFIYNDVKENRINKKLLNFLKEQIKDNRKTFVFFHDITYMHHVFKIYQPYFSNIECVSSKDKQRHEKVNRLRAGEIDIMFTTTILERGVTLEYLDVVIIRCDEFECSAIVQIAGRVGRKWSCTTGKVICYHVGITKKMTRARNEIVNMNRLAQEKGWLK